MFLILIFLDPYLPDSSLQNAGITWFTYIFICQIIAYKMQETPDTIACFCPYWARSIPDFPNFYPQGGGSLLYSISYKYSFTILLPVVEKKCEVLILLPQVPLTGLAVGIIIATPTTLSMPDIPFQPLILVYRMLLAWKLYTFWGLSIHSHTHFTFVGPCAYPPLPLL